MKIIGKPYSGKPNVRFDEGELEIEHAATTPALYSTELETEKSLIDDPSMPVRFYNYSFIRDQIMKKHHQEVSVPTIIDRAKKRILPSEAGKETS
jgi:hypothetical protein